MSNPRSRHNPALAPTRQSRPFRSVVLVAAIAAACGAMFGAMGLVLALGAGLGAGVGIVGGRFALRLLDAGTPPTHRPRVGDEPGQTPGIAPHSG